jgi:hypothetical protein
MPRSNTKFPISFSYYSYLQQQVKDGSGTKRLFSAASAKQAEEGEGGDAASKRPCADKEKELEKEKANEMEPEKASQESDGEMFFPPTQNDDDEGSFLNPLDYMAD